MEEHTTLLSTGFASEAFSPLGEVDRNSKVISNLSDEDLSMPSATANAQLLILSELYDGKN